MTAERADSTSADVESAVRAAEELFEREGLAGEVLIANPRGPQATRAAIVRLGELFAALPGMMRYGLRQQRDNGGDLSTDPLQGLSEVVQNADDLCASTVRVLVRETELLMAHNGSPVTLPDVMALAMPWLTSKADDPDTTGRFGIGLMTLQRLSAVLEVFCGDYRVRIGDPDVSLAEPLATPPWFAGQCWTVLRIPLDEPGGVQVADVEDWLAGWGDQALLFLRHVREVVHLAGDGSSVTRLALQWSDPERHQGVVGGRPVAVDVCMARALDGRTWDVSHADVPSPADVARARKAAGESTRLSVALPRHSTTDHYGQGSAGYVHVGLPVAELGLPIRLSAQFDPNPSRQSLNPTAWNRALCPLLADLWAAAVARLVQSDPAAAWQCLPLPGDVIAPNGPVRALEEELLALARKRLSYEIRVPTRHHGDLGIADLAICDEALAHTLSEAEIAQAAERTAVLPRSARDEHGRWRQVLRDWAENDAAVLATVDVATALNAFLDDASRSPESTIELAAVGIYAGRTTELRWRSWLVDADVARHAVARLPGGEPFTDEVRGLWKALGLSRALHPAFTADTPDAGKARAWLIEQGALVTGTDPVLAIRWLATRGAGGLSTRLSLNDQQLVALRDGFLRIDAEEREQLGRRVGLAILVSGRRFGAAGERETGEVSPAHAYLPAGLDSVERDNSFEFAAGQAGLWWILPRYAEILRGGGTGLGARAFFHLLGAQKGPRLRPHAGAVSRFSASNPNEGLPARISGGPAERRRDLASRGADYTLEDCDSPDLAAVIDDIAAERDGVTRRRRAAALLRVLNRVWGTLSEHHKVRAVHANYGWNDRGETDGFWLWHLKTTAWLDDQDGVPSAPFRLLERTTSTVAVYGARGTGFLHPDLQHAVGKRGEILVALGVAGEPELDALLRALRRLRDQEDAAPDHPAAQLLYQALAERLTTPRGREAVRTTARVVRAFQQGKGLVLTQLGWRQPAECLRGAPVFGRWAAWAPSFTGSDSLWAALGIPEAGVEDAVRVIKTVAGALRKGKTASAPDDTGAETVMLQSLQFLARTAREDPKSVTASVAGKLPLFTSSGWTSKRPVYAADATVAEALGSRLPVWQPGADLEQFRTLLGPLRVTELAADVAILADMAAVADEEATAVVRSAIALLREDLQRNAPAAARSLDVDWNDLLNVEVRFTSSLACQVRLPDGTAASGQVRTALDWQTRTLWTIDGELLGRPLEAGRTIAARFARFRREVAHAWPAAYEQAERGRAAVRLRLAEERVEQAQAATEAERERRLAALESELEVARSNDSSALPARPARQPHPTAAGPPPAPRAFVDPTALRISSSRRTKPLSVRPPEGSRTSGSGGFGTTGDRLQQPAGVPTARGPRPMPPAHHVDQAERVALDLLRKVLGTEREPGWLRDLRAQHHVGADAMDGLGRFYELKTAHGAEPDSVTLTAAEYERASAGDQFFLVVVSGLAAGAEPTLRLIQNPLRALASRPSSHVTLSGIRRSAGLVVTFGPMASS